MRKVDYNIEYAHIYTDEKFNREHLESSWALNHTIKKLKELNKSYSSVILIDNYNPIEHILDENEFINKMKKNNANPDFIGYEAELAPLYNKVLNQLNHKSEKKSIKHYVRTREKVPCSFLIVIWNLLRLGVVKNGIEFYKENGNHNKQFIGEKLITILPERFRSVEERATEVLKNSTYADVLNRIEHIYF